MRSNIYYWKCDNPLPITEKLIYNDKYKSSDISTIVRDIAIHHFQREPIEIISTGSNGNHYAYHIVYPEITYFFRSDDGKIEDDYMEAEKVAIKYALDHGVPAPVVIFTETSKSLFPIRYQIMENVPGKSMRHFFEDKSLEIIPIARELGKYLVTMHSIKTDGFGFFDTNLARERGVLKGLDNTNQEYFYKKLDDHLRYLGETHFLRTEEIDEIYRLFDKFSNHLNIGQGYLVHKDIAFWNMVGTPKNINAIVDWDDVISGDPMDDLAVIRCFYGEDVFIPLIEGYTTISTLPNDYPVRLWLYMVRNMVWKAVFRSFMGYFDFDEKVQILNREKNASLKHFTYNQIHLGITELQKL